ncbi:U6 snRNA phosphodiesterase 1 isoform X2 [Bacillus rossius redtenbacheri]|uniref:U6 snRNA phosphodiesterase 1 isoform X2 n=1 Tax=Bacillus rossius redtenbacheri TaxID=93214 RepID=UPI002FDEEE34
MRLPSPLGLDQIFPLTASAPVDNPEQHDGRVRSFPHERGNWSTLVYIHYEPSIVLESFVDVVKVICSTDVGLALKAPDELHISLTRTVVLRHHWIDSFVASVRQIFEAVARFQLTFGSVDVYTNEEKTRTFVGLVVELGQRALQSCVGELDKCLAEFRLQPFYDDPSFHMTVAWCVGDHKTEIATVLPQLNEVFKQFLYTHPEQWTSAVRQLSCKSGNKKYVFPLAR